MGNRQETTAPRCSVVLVTWNRRREMELALDSIFAQTIADQLEVIVIDNGSTDGTVEWLANEYPHPVRLFEFKENRGACHGRNAGILLARAPYVCFLDSDAVILSANAIERCLEELSRRGPEVRAVAAPIWFDREHKRAFALGGYITSEGQFHGARTRTDTKDPHFISTCFAVWERRLLLELGGFDPWYFWGIEDVDLSLRARWRAKRGEKRGATKFVIVEDVEILHEMASGGRHYQPHEFDPVFYNFERQRMYLVLGYGGLWEFLRVLLTTPLHLRRTETMAWEQPLPWRKRLWMWALYPAVRVLMLPKDVWHQRRDHLKGAPMPKEVARRGVVENRV